MLFNKTINICTFYIRTCDVDVLDMKNPDVAKKAEELGIKSIPAVAVNDKLAIAMLAMGQVKWS